MEEDFSNYSVTVENPVHTVYRGKRLTHATQLQLKLCFAGQEAAMVFSKS